MDGQSVPTLGNAVQHRDEPIAPRRLESMPVCRTQHFAHRNEEEDTTERWSNSPERTQSVSITSQGRLYQERYFGGRADVVFKDESTWPRSLFSSLRVMAIARADSASIHLRPCHAATNVDTLRLEDSDSINVTRTPIITCSTGSPSELVCSTDVRRLTSSPSLIASSLQNRPGTHST